MTESSKQREWWAVFGNLQPPYSVLRKSLVFQVALRCETPRAMDNQMQPVLIDALLSAQQRFSGCFDTNVG